MFSKVFVQFPEKNFSTEGNPWTFSRKIFHEDSTETLKKNLS